MSNLLYKNCTAAYVPVPSSALSQQGQAKPCKCGILEIGWESDCTNSPTSRVSSELIQPNRWSQNPTVWVAKQTLAFEKVDFALEVFYAESYWDQSVVIFATVEASDTIQNDESLLDCDSISSCSSKIAAALRPRSMTCGSSPQILMQRKAQHKSWILHCTTTI